MLRNNLEANLEAFNISYAFTSEIQLPVNGHVCGFFFFFLLLIGKESLVVVN